MGSPFLAQQCCYYYSRPDAGPSGEPSNLYCGSYGDVNLTGQPVELEISLSKANCGPSLNLDSTSSRFWLAYQNPPTTPYYAIWSIVGYNKLTGENEGEIFK